MGEQPPCVRDGCRIPGRHGEDCPGDDCRGCLRAQAADGLRLCRYDTDRIGQDATVCAELYDELALRLSGGTGSGEPVSGTSDTTRLPNPAAVEARATIRHTLVAWCRLISEERGFLLPPDTVEAMAAYIMVSATWLAATEYAAEVADELRDLRSMARRVAHPSGARVIEVAPCPLPNCAGTVKAIVRPADSLLPSELVCDTDDEHRWPAGTWHSFRRAVKARAA